MGSPFSRYLAPGAALFLGGAVCAALGYGVLAASQDGRTGGAVDAAADSSPVPASASPILSGSAVGFEDEARTWLKAYLKRGPGAQAEQVAGLTEELQGTDPVGTTRAAVLLGAIVHRDTAPTAARDARKLAASLLRSRLAARVDTGARWSVGADIAAARGLDSTSVGDAAFLEATAQLLAELAAGEAPHPNLAVRVECAASALALLEAAPNVQADQSLTGFLLAVLRAETPDQTKSPRTWPRITTLAWVKTRASMALARRAGLEDRYRPDGSWAHQVAEANRLEAGL